MVLVSGVQGYLCPGYKDISIRGKRVLAASKVQGCQCELLDTTDLQY